MQFFNRRFVRTGWLDFGAERYQAGSAWRLVEMPKSMALLSLLQNTPHTLNETPEMVGCFERAVAGALCLTGQRADATAAADQIMCLVDTTA